MVNAATETWLADTAMAPVSARGPTARRRKARKLPIGWQAGHKRPNAKASGVTRQPDRIKGGPRAFPAAALIVISLPLRCKWVMH
jgi:hypothetical protein